MATPICGDIVTGHPEIPTALVIAHFVDDVSGEITAYRVVQLINDRPNGVLPLLHEKTLTMANWLMLDVPADALQDLTILRRVTHQTLHDVTEAINDHSA